MRVMRIGHKVRPNKITVADVGFEGSCVPGESLTTLWRCLVRLCMLESLVVVCLCVDGRALRACKQACVQMRAMLCVCVSEWVEGSQANYIHNWWNITEGLGTPGAKNLGRIPVC